MSSGRFFVSLLLLLLFADKEERMKHIPQKNRDYFHIYQKLTIFAT